VHLHYRFLHGTEQDWRHFAAASLMQFLNLVRSVAGPGWRPTAIHLPMHDLPGSRAVPLLADTPITFGQSAVTITFSAALLHRPLPWAPPMTTSTEVASWERSKPGADVGGAVRQVITTMLRSGIRTFISSTAGRSAERARLIESRAAIRGCATRPTNRPAWSRW
jgi:hypothetical protein